MPFYEVIYENGEVSVAEYANDDEAVAAVTAQHERAKAGGKNGPQGVPASRVVKVLVYDVHPGSLYEDETLSSDEVQAQVKDLLKDKDVVNVPQLAEIVKSFTHPMRNPENPHDSRFRMDEDRELELGLA